MISTRGRYALRVMLDLAERGEAGFIPLKDVAERQGISKKYLEMGASGKGGGYRLVREPKDYSVGEILELMEGTIAPVACLASGAKECPRASACETLPMWAEFDAMMHDFFYSKKLTDLLRKDS